MHAAAKLEDWVDSIEALRAALGDAAVAEESAARAVAKAQLLLDEATRRLANFADLDAEISRHRAAGAKAFAATGSRPDEKLPHGLQLRVKARAEAQEAVASYSAANAGLMKELVAASKQLARVRWQIGQEAVAIFTRDAEAIIDEIRQLFQSAWKLSDQIFALERLKVPDYDGVSVVLPRWSHKVQMFLLEARAGWGRHPTVAAVKVVDTVAVESAKWEPRLQELLETRRKELTNV